MLNKQPKHQPSRWPKCVPRQKPDRWKESAQKNQIPVQIRSGSSPMCSCCFFLFFFLFFYFLLSSHFSFFVFIFSIFFCCLGAHKKEAQNFTTNGCKLWSTKNLEDVMKNKNSTLGQRSLSSKGNFGILIFAQPVSPTHGWMQNLILPDFKKKTLF